MKPRVAVSACLLGLNVRYDGGHQRDEFVSRRLPQVASIVSVCPEMGIGLPSPRPSLQLRIEGHGTRLVCRKTGRDFTVAMNAWSRAKVAELQRKRIDGVILKRASPSCGMERVRRFRADGETAGPVDRLGEGLFARALREHLPLVVVEEEGRLNDPGLRDLFLTRLFARKRLRALFEGEWRVSDLVAFHAREKFLLMAHNEERMRALGRLVAHASTYDSNIVRDWYSHGFMGAFARPARVKSHVNVLEHLTGFLKRELDSGDKTEIHSMLSAFRAGRSPRLEPLTLVRHWARRVGNPYLSNQTYLRPYPSWMATV